MNACFAKSSRHRRLLTTSSTIPCERGWCPERSTIRSAEVVPWTARRLGLETQAELRTDPRLGLENQAELRTGPSYFEQALLFDASVAQTRTVLPVAIAAGSSAVHRYSPYQRIAVV